jgi:endonuclease III
MERKQVVTELMKTIPGRFSTELGIELEGSKKEEVFKWFLASLLFGTRIGESIVTKTYRAFASAGVLSPRTILATGWDGLVQLLDQGGYVRYDYKTATKLLEICANLENEYQGDLNSLHAVAKSAEDLERLLLDSKGVGPVTVNIFLRELRGIWKFANPIPGDLAVTAALDLGLISRKEAGDGRSRLSGLQRTWEAAKVKGTKFSDFESALVRLGKNYCRRKREACPMRQYHV